MKMDQPLGTVLSGRRKMTSYHVGLLQAKAYRIVKNRTGEILQTHNLAPIEWALLGQLYEKKNGMRFAEMAQILGVEAPFVTVLIENLKKKNLIAYETDQKDKRAKRVFLTLEGRSAIPTIDRDLKKEMKRLIPHSSNEEFNSYFRVLDAIVTNATG